MAKRGKTPSLIGGGAGACKQVTAKCKRRCKRCGRDVLRGELIVEVTKPGTLGGYKPYCRECFIEILDQTQSDLDKLRKSCTE